MTNSKLSVLLMAADPDQTIAKRVLCVCSAGILRSPTAANVLHIEFGFNTRAAGTSEAFALIPVTHALLHWADEIVVMETEHFKCISVMLDEYDLDKPIKVLDIPDDFEWGDPALVGMITRAYKRTGVKCF